MYNISQYQKWKYHIVVLKVILFQIDFVYQVVVKAVYICLRTAPMIKLRNTRNLTKKI